MAKYCGKIGFAETAETSPGVWEETIVERKYFGDVLQNTKRNQTADKVNVDIMISNSISIISDPYADSNFGHIRYVEWMNQRWTVNSVKVAYPRLVLEVGGIYNG